jgi:hypothetical protein
MNVYVFFRSAPVVSCFCCLLLTAVGLGAEILYNGIRLPSPWPPRVVSLSREPAPAPYYLAAPPAVIPIDVGRQLFVDDFLIQWTDLRRTFHQAEYHPASPVLKADRPWEKVGRNTKREILPGKYPTATVFSDGVWFDPRDKLFKLWYMCGYRNAMCYATSKDGVQWEKPSLDVVAGTNIVNPARWDSSIVWLDLDEKDPQKRFKLFHTLSSRMRYQTSPDGIHWSDLLARSEGGLDGRQTAFYNPFRRVWGFSLRQSIDPPEGMGRLRRYYEHPDPLEGTNWKMADTVLWVGADRLDTGGMAQLYNLDAVAYESLMLGAFSILSDGESGRPKANKVLLGFSRDGFYWTRPDRQPFINVGERGSWNEGNVQSAGGVCLVVRDKLYFYSSARRRIPGTSGTDECSAGLSILRRDGFASMDAGSGGGVLTTRPVRFQGKYLFVNAAAKGGELRVEILDKDDHVIRPYSLENSIGARADATILPMRWKGAKDLGGLAGKPVRFRFSLKRGSLYSFWVSPSETGASHGYIAAGGPGFTGPTDTAGKDGYK